MNQLDLVAENQRLKAKNQALEKAIEQFMWERDVAIEQLVSYGVGFAEKADVVRVVHGHWKTEKRKNIWREYIDAIVCSECNKISQHGLKTEYCSRCGAKMDGDTK